MRGKGANGDNGGPPGDLYVVVKVQAHRLFGRNGDNLTLTCRSPSTRPRSAPTSRCRRCAGPPVTLKVPAGTPSGRTFRVRGKGARRADGTLGDLLVTVEVQVPAVLDPAAREAIEAYRAATAGKPLRSNLFEGA